MHYRQKAAVYKTSRQQDKRFLRHAAADSAARAQMRANAIASRLQRRRRHYWALPLELMT